MMKMKIGVSELNSLRGLGKQVSIGSISDLSILSFRITPSFTWLSVLTLTVGNMMLKISFFFLNLINKRRENFRLLSSSMAGM